MISSRPPLFFTLLKFHLAQLMLDVSIKKARIILKTKLLLKSKMHILIIIEVKPLVFFFCKYSRLELQKRAGITMWPGKS